MVTVGFDPSVVDDFFENVAHSDKMWIKFADGSEPDWVIPMEGSRNSVNAFKDCVAKLAPTQTQPFDNSNSTQPFSKGGKKAGEESF